MIISFLSCFKGMSPEQMKTVIRLLQKFKPKEVHCNSQLFQELAKKFTHAKIKPHEIDKDKGVLQLVNTLVDAGNLIICTLTSKKKCRVDKVLWLGLDRVRQQNKIYVAIGPSGEII